MGKNAAVRSHNLKEVIKNFSDNMRYDDYGLNSLDYETPQDSDDVIISVAVDQAKGTRDMSFVNEYLKKIANNEITPEPYFTENDGEIYWLLKRWLEVKDKPNKESDVRLIDLCRFFNVLNRQVNGDMYKMFDPIKDHLHDKLNAKAISKAYHSGKSIKIAPSLESPVTFFIYGKQWTRNPLKEAAWGVVHSYLIDRLMSENYQYRLIPKDRELVIIWNHYIDMMNDVPEEVKKYYYLNSDCESLFTKHFKDEKACTNELENTHPVDDHEKGATDIPFESAIVDNIIKVESKEEEEKVKNIPEMVKSTDNDNIIKVEPKEEEKKVESTSEKVESASDTVVQVSDEKKESTSGSVQTNNNIIDADFKVIKVDGQGVETVVEEKKDSSVVEEKKTPQQQLFKRPEEPDVNISLNNESFERSVPKLNKFTNIARRKGYSVLYGMNASFPRLIQAVVINRETKVPERAMLIDPCVIYGDTLRVVSMTSKKLDIRKESFVAISQTAVIEKMINGSFGKEDRKKNFEQLPHCLNDFRDTYVFLDRIDLHDCQSMTMKSDGKTISFNEWKKLIINISNILKNENIPVCRFRLQEYVNCNNFKLICDERVDIFYKSNIANEPSQQKAKAEKFWVDYNPEQYGDAGFSFGVMNPLPETK